MADDNTPGHQVVNEVPSSDVERSESEGSSRNGDDDDELDPRIEENLEILNAASEQVNRLEKELSEVRLTIHETLNESGQKLTALMNSHKKAIARVKPFYQARYEARRAHIANQKATKRFEKAISMHKGAMESVAAAEQNFVPQREATVSFDATSVEMLNQANDRFAESEKEKVAAQEEHRKTADIFEEARQRVRMLQNKLKSSIEKSKLFFEVQAHYFQLLEKQKRQVHEIQKKLLDTKSEYSEAMSTLERISEEIHKRRQLNRKLSERKLGRDIAVSVGDDDIDLDDVDGMVRDLALGLGVDPMGSLDSLQSEVSGIDADSDAANSSNDISSSEPSSRRMSSELEAVGTLQTIATNTDQSERHSIAETECENEQMREQETDSTDGRGKDECEDKQKEEESEELRGRQAEWLRQEQAERQDSRDTDRKGKMGMKEEEQLMRPEQPMMGQDEGQRERREEGEMERQEEKEMERQEKEETERQEEEMERQEEKEIERQEKKQTERQEEEQMERQEDEQMERQEEEQMERQEEEKMERQEKEETKKREERETERQEEKETERREEEEMERREEEETERREEEEGQIDRQEEEATERREEVHTDRGHQNYGEDCGHVGAAEHSVVT